MGMINTIANTIKRLAVLGIKPDYPLIKHLQIKFLNLDLLTYIGLTCCSILTFSSYLSQNPLIAFFFIGIILLFGIALFCNSKGQHTFAASTALISPLVFLLIFHFLWGSEATENYLILSLSLTSLIYYHKKNWMANAYLFLHLVAFLVLAFVPVKPLMPLGEEMIVFIRGYNIVFAGFIFGYKAILLAYIYHISLTQTRQKVEQLSQTNLKLKKALQSNIQLENFAAIASHDLKSPLRTITSFSQLLKRSAASKLDDNELEYLQFITDNTKSLHLFVEDLLAFSKMKSIEKKEEVFDLKNMLSHLLASLQSSIKEKGAFIRLKNLPNDIKGDQIKIRQLFQNLIANAIKFHYPETPPVVTVEAAEFSAYWKFSVKDKGIGISKEFHQEVFQLFSKLHSSKEYKGSGIGLATCQLIVEQHGGKIWIESEMGDGATFYFTIPKMRVGEALQEFKLVHNNGLIPSMIHSI